MYKSWSEYQTRSMAWWDWLKGLYLDSDLVFNAVSFGSVHWLGLTYQISTHSHFTHPLSTYWCSTSRQSHPQGLLDYSHLLIVILPLVDYARIAVKSLWGLNSTLPSWKRHLERTSVQKLKQLRVVLYPADADVEIQQACSKFSKVIMKLLC